MAQLKIYRLKEWNSKLRSFEIIIDGEKVSEINAGEQLSLDVSPGEHILNLKIDFVKSKDLPIHVDSTHEDLNFTVHTRYLNNKWFKLSLFTNPVSMVAIWFEYYFIAGLFAIPLLIVVFEWLYNKLISKSNYFIINKKTELSTH